MRRVLLWMAGSDRLRRWLPNMPFARRAVRRFMPGESLAEAVDAARPLQDVGIGVILTHLGENVTDAGEADAVERAYVEALGKIGRNGIDGEISVKLTQLGLDIDADGAERRTRALAACAQATGSYLWIDMESSQYVERTLDIYERVRRAYPSTGLCIQAYLRRSEADVQRLLPLSPSIRLVKGAYDEPASIAWRSRRDIDDSFVRLAQLLLESAVPGMRVRLGTHDVELIERVVRKAQDVGAPEGTVEVEMLYGIRADEQRRLAREGFRVRTLISYGQAWYAWYMRRLAERPANVIFALRQLVP